MTLVAILLAVARPAPRPAVWTPLGRDRRRRLVTDTGRLLAAGYLAFLGIVVLFRLFSWMLQHDASALGSAMTGVPFLMAITAPVWALLTWNASRRHRGPARGWSRRADRQRPVRE